MFSESDLKQIHDRGMAVETIQNQIHQFIQGFPFISLVRPATAGDGIMRPGEEEKSGIVKFFESRIEKLEVVKFVPASGAASRMFKHLFEFREKYTSGKSGDELFIKDLGFNSVWHFYNHLSEIAFCHELSVKLQKNGYNLKELLDKKDFNTIADHILGSAGLDYSNLPKGLILFHDYPEKPRTAAEEHMVEAALYASNSKRTARLHYTISPEHRTRFEELFHSVQTMYESNLNVAFDISFSFQKPSTDTIAVDEENNPFRTQDGQLLFRPAGHGALLQNLNDIDADVIFIKNIDNIVPDRLKEPTVFNKKLLGGYLLFVREYIHNFLRKSVSHEHSLEDIAKTVDFCKKYISAVFPDDFENWENDAKTGWLISYLNRPIRVCGMVKNEGEPGGGPYWVRNKNGELSLQIVESSQVNLKDPEQSEIFRAATHFNPVDLVCSAIDFKGSKFDLSRYVDKDTGFISVKSSGGRNLKALELPGLWNGAMAEWITVFMEVPIITFNPVKTVNDLLRKEHLSS